ncbi:hypothetical protein JTB14_024769 [Gonioctena quinquepunctata]|nr:hypothetical protein JTB14_024769 [Gonioctena quinquepunctata]
MGKHVKVWECGICSKEFTHQYTLMRHLPTHTDERKFQCITCGKGNLRNHIFTHTNERPYKCDICEKGFNQMSNLMCHKFKAHQRTEKPKYVCQICARSFPKRMGLRHHEQFSHGMVNPPPVTSPIPEKLNYMNAIVVDPIRTEAMRLAIESNQTPFALLRPLSGIPVLVRVLPAGDKQMLVPASAEDLKKHSHISITPKSDAAADKENIDKNGKQVGSTVQIKIPVVATVVQQNDMGGQLSMSVVSPGPNGELGDQSGMIDANLSNFIYSSTLTSNDSVSEGNVNIADIPLAGGFEASDIIGGVDMEFLDEEGRRADENNLTQSLEVDSSNIILEDNPVSSITESNDISLLCAEGLGSLLAQNVEENSEGHPQVVGMGESF